MPCPTKKFPDEFFYTFWQHCSYEACKLCIHERATYVLRHLHMACKRRMGNLLSANLRRAKDIQCMERTPGTYNSLCVHAKNRQILVRGKWYANQSQMAQHRFAVPSTHTYLVRERFTNHSARSCMQGYRNGSSIVKQLTQSTTRCL